jgi:hypothetical protein
MQSAEKDLKVKRLYCPFCRKWLLCVAPQTQGKLYPYCKRCKKEVEILISNEPTCAETTE